MLITKGNWGLNKICAFYNVIPFHYETGLFETTTLSLCLIFKYHS